MTTEAPKPARKPRARVGRHASSERTHSPTTEDSGPAQFHQGTTGRASTPVGSGTQLAPGSR